MRVVSVLWVDEDPLVARATVRSLQRWLEIRIAIGLAAAWRELARREPNVLVVDLHLDGLKSLRLMSLVARRYPNVRRVLMSWWPDSDAQLVPSGLAEALIPKGEARALERVIWGLEP